MNTNILWHQPEAWNISLVRLLARIFTWLSFPFLAIKRWKTEAYFFFRIWYKLKSYSRLKITIWRSVHSVVLRWLCSPQSQMWALLFFAPVSWPRSFCGCCLFLRKRVHTQTFRKQPWYRPTLIPWSVLGVPLHRATFSFARFFGSLLGIHQSSASMLIW